MTQTNAGIRFQVATTTVLSTGARAWVVVDTVDLSGFGGAARVGGLFKSPESAQRKADALNAATKTPYPLTEQQAQDLADRVNAAPGLIGRAAIEYHARSGRWGIFLTDRVGCDVSLGQTVEGVDAFLASRHADYFRAAPAAPATPATPAEVPTSAAPAPVASAPVIVRIVVNGYNITSDVQLALTTYDLDHDAATYIAQTIAYNAGREPGVDHGDLEFSWEELQQAEAAIASYRTQVAANAVQTRRHALDQADRSLDYSSTHLDAPERTQRIIADACQRSLDEKRLIWVASFDPGAEWGQGRCWYNTDIEPLATDRIEGTARAGHYMPVQSR